MSDLELTSPKSARVVEVRHLHDRRHRSQRGAFVVEGPTGVEAAIRHAVRAKVREVFASPAAAARHAGLLAQARRKGARVTVASEDVLRAMSETRAPQGLIAVCDLVATSLDDAMDSAGTRSPLVVILDRVSDPGNAGTIIRSADACGATAVLMTPGSVDPHNGKCVRASAGSIFSVPIASDIPLTECLTAVKARDARILAASADGDVTLGTPTVDTWLQGPVAWLFGNEAHGLESDDRHGADATVSIPMSGGAESFNLAAAAAICLYATSQARRAK